MGLLFNLHWGLVVGMGVALVLFGIFAVWGEKLILINVKARYVTDDELLINQVKNFCTHLEIDFVKIYWSNIFINNLYYTNTYFGKPALIIGRNVYNTLTRNELNSLIYASLLKLKGREAKHRTTSSLIFLVLYSPVYLLRSIISYEPALKIINIFLYPAYFLKSKVYSTKDIILFDKKVGNLRGLKNDYISALFKVSQLQVCNEKSIGGLLVNDLCHVSNLTEDALWNLLIEQVSIEDRVKALK